MYRADEKAAFDQKTGSKIWWVKVRSTGVGSPVAEGNSIYVSTWNNFGEPDLRVPMPDFAAFLQQYDKDGDGAVSAAEFPEVVPLARRPESSAKCVDLTLPGKVIFGGIDQNKDGKVDKAEWDAAMASRAASPEHGLLAIKDGGHGDVAATHLLWRESRSVAEVPTPLFSGGRVYMVTNGGVVSCLKRSVASCSSGAGSGQVDLISLHRLRQVVTSTSFLPTESSRSFGTAIDLNL